MMVKQMLFMDAPAHTRLRKLAAPAFTPKRVRLLRDHIREIATKLIDDVQRRRDGTMELLADFAEPLPAIVTAEMFGIPVEDHVRLKDWSATFAGMLGNFQHNPDQIGDALEAVENLTAYFQDAILASKNTSTAGIGALAHDE